MNQSSSLVDTAPSSCVEEVVDSVIKELSSHQSLMTRPLTSLVGHDSALEHLGASIHIYANTKPVVEFVVRFDCEFFRACPSARSFRG